MGLEPDDCARGSNFTHPPDSPRVVLVRLLVWFISETIIYDFKLMLQPFFPYGHFASGFDSNLCGPP